jgi:hypothetical protein
MALPTTTLCSLADVKEELGIAVTTYDTRIERLIQAINAEIESYCGRVLYYATGIAESVAGFGGTRLLLARTPIVSITSITIDGLALAATDYEVEDAAAGCVEEGEGCLDEEERGAHVDGHDAVEEIRSDALDAAADDPCGIVDEAVEAAEGAGGGSDEVGGEIRVGEVAGEEGAAEAGGGFCGFGGVVTVQEDRSAFAGAASGDGFADAGGATGDEDGVSGEALHGVGSADVEDRLGDAVPAQREAAP